jgi:uncharacterized membrane protein
MRHQRAQQANGVPYGMAIAAWTLLARVVPASLKDATGRAVLPMAFLFYFVVFFVIFSTLVLIEIGMLNYAAERLGIDRRHIASLLMLCFLGSYVNIPVAQLPGEEVQTTQVVSYFGRPYLVPVAESQPPTILAVNLGGAIVPVCLAVYLVVKNRLYVEASIGVLIVTTLVHFLASPIPGMGISVPVFLPPIAAAIVAVLLSWKQSAALAYISGTLGTLIGADILNLGVLSALGGPVASIGGAGTFDGVFLTGILAMLLA